MPKVFIIILNWNHWLLTEDCLKSLQDINYDNFQVIVVDNNSRSEEKDLMKKSVLRPFFILIENKENLGFAGGNNVGIKYALENGADYVLLLNNDTLIDDKDFLKKLIEVAESDKKTCPVRNKISNGIGIVGPKIYYWPFDSALNHTIQGLAQGKSAGRRIWFGGGKLNWLKTRAWHLKNETQGKTDFITGCCLLIKREVIEKIGLIPEEFFLYFEDADWCLKAKKAAYQCVYVPSAWIWHKVASSTKEFSYNYIYYNTRNGFLLGWRHGNFFQRIIIFFLGFWLMLKQIIKILFNYKKEWSKAILHGAWDFYRRKFGPLN